MSRLLERSLEGVKRCVWRASSGVCIGRLVVCVEGV